MKLGTRLTIVLVGLVVLLMSVHAFVEIFKGKEHLLQMLTKDAHLVLRVLTANFSSSPFSITPHLQSLVEQMVESKEVQALRWFESPQKILFSAGNVPADITLTNALWQQFQYSQQSVSQLHRTATETLFVYWYPLFATESSLQGVVLLLLPVTEMERFEDSTLFRNLFSILGITLLLILAIVTLIRRWVTDPLATLLTGIDALGRGELSQRIPVLRQDEVGEVASAFNRMTSLLQETQNHLIEEKEYSHSIIESINTGIIVVDTEGQITTWNRAMEEEYQIASAEVLGQRLSDLFPTLVEEGVISIVEQLCRGEQTAVQLESVTHRTRHRGTVILNIRGYSLKDVTGMVRGAVLVIEDITEKVLLQRQVVQTEKLAAVGQLTASLAHEIGTPLNIIQTRTEYVLKKLPAEGFPKEQLEKILQQIDRIVRIVRRLLDFTRQKAPTFQPVHLHTLFENIAELLAPQLRKQQITLIIPAKGELPVVEGDADQLQQVLFNLCLNALQAMPYGGKLTVTSDADQIEHQEVVTLYIQDTGEGIPAEHLPYIFDPFFTTKPAGTGTGLGLTISQQIVQAHGGTLTVTSTVGEGTTFILTLPRYQRKAVRNIYFPG